MFIRTFYLPMHNTCSTIVILLVFLVMGRRLVAVVAAVQDTGANSMLLLTTSPNLKANQFVDAQMHNPFSAHTIRYCEQNILVLMNVVKLAFMKSITGLESSNCCRRCSR